MKIFCSLFVSVVALFFFALLSPSYAQNIDISVCEAHGFGDTGCMKCTAPNPDAIPLNCRIEDQGVSGGVACRAGATAPDPSICANIQDYGQCITTYIPCVEQTVPNGGFFCQAAGRQCKQCDYDPSTSIPTCPAGPPPPYATYDDCLANCTLVGDSASCTGSGGICKSACEGGDMVLDGLTCPDASTPFCCRPINEQAAPGLALQLQGRCLAEQIDTAIGCIPYSNINAIPAFFITWGVRFAGGIALLLIIVASIMVIISTGDPERLQSGKELLTSAISGILLIIFAIFILRFIGFNVLGIFV